MKGPDYNRIGKIEYPGQEIGKVRYTEGTSLTLLKSQKTGESYKFERKRTKLHPLH